MPLIPGRALIAIGTSIAFLPSVIDPFVSVPTGIVYASYALAVAMFALYLRLRRKDQRFRAEDLLIQDETMAFYARYPWRPVATALLVLFSLVLPSVNDRLGLTAEQALAIGVGLWALTHLIGDVVYAGRRTPKPPP